MGANRLLFGAVEAAFVELNEEVGGPPSEKPLDAGAGASGAEEAGVEEAGADGLAKLNAGAAEDVLKSELFAG